MAEPDKVITKSPQEFKGVPTCEANVAGIRATRQMMEMVHEQSLVLDGVDDEQGLIERSTHALMDAILDLGDGDVARGTVRAFDTGALDVPFPSSECAAGDVLPARDDDGRVRLLKFGDLAIDADSKEVHDARLDERAQTEGRDPSFRLVADDVDAITDGRLIGRPEGGEGDAN
ncbi:hypothetical protein VB779_04430 [Haloarculaceae archaeon H-GB11]|nr:hypothetical protein [Haloarculaceae archaeon H-GB11]